MTETSDRSNRTDEAKLGFRRTFLCGWSVDASGIQGLFVSEYPQLLNISLRMDPRGGISSRGSDLEWLFRLSQEPRRLWRRYILYGYEFLLFAVLEIMGVGKTD
jgi:hypothetical protein